MGGQKGFTLLETSIALTILAVIAVSIFFALNVSIKATARVDHHTTAESLIRTALEIVKQCGYDSTNNLLVYQDLEEHSKFCCDPVCQSDMSIPDGYDVVVTAERLYPSGTPTPEDQGMQRITVEVKYDGDPVMTTDAYKVQR